MGDRRRQSPPRHGRHRITAGPCLIEPKKTQGQSFQFLNGQTLTEWIFSYKQEVAKMIELTETIRQKFLDAPISSLVDDIIKANRLDPDRLVVRVARSRLSIENDSFEIKDSI